MKKAHDFSFSDHAAGFDDHIGKSIWGLAELRRYIVNVSPRFIGSRSNVYDIGCSTGTHLRSVYDNFDGRRSEVSFQGFDIVPGFEEHWRKLEAPGLSYGVSDARHLTYQRASLVMSMFTLQFLPSADKMPLLRRVYDGVLDGGCLLIAEKVLAETGRMQDALAFPYYDFKQANGFTADEILDKERSLRGQMTLWTKPEAEGKLREAGFADVQTIWEHFPFVCWIALKH